VGVVKHYYCNSLDLENFKPLTEEIEKKTFLTNESWSIAMIGKLPPTGSCGYLM
jgi:hypothetical protein